MIGVIANPADREVVCEFFELFKTPWEFYRKDQHYDVVICADGSEREASAELIVTYSGNSNSCDDRARIASQRTKPCVLSYRESRIPIYGPTVSFAGARNVLLKVEGSEECAAYLDEDGGRSRARIGYDLFSEIHTLLTVGQPHFNASIPTLELHIALLSDLLTECGISFVEIPPVPEGCQLVACLTHDVDHPSICKHGLDHTVIGFLLRATFGSLIDVFRGRMSIRDGIQNWLAVIKLPFVYVGFAKDFWRDFDRRYLQVEGDLPSTFFMIPRRGYAGRRADDNPAPPFRAARYAAAELADSISKLRAAGHEVGLHGIDAWIDSSAGREELEEIRHLTGVAETGARMHWLYYNEESPAKLEQGGATYDSTIGYNDTVGYRAGTTQAYRPVGVERLLELPLHAMDTALFYPSYLHLTSREASTRLRQLTDDVVRYGGCLTVNWHDRSLAPERLWDGCYRELIQDLKSRGAWFATAGQATAWFRKRRSATFEADDSLPGAVRVEFDAEWGASLPGLRLRIRDKREAGETGARRSVDYLDITVDQCAEKNVSAEARR